MCRKISFPMYFPNVITFGKYKGNKLYIDTTFEIYVEIGFLEVFISQRSPFYGITAQDCQRYVQKEFIPTSFPMYFPNVITLGKFEIYVEIGFLEISIMALLHFTTFHGIPWHSTRYLHFMAFFEKHQGNRQGTNCQGFIQTPDLRCIFLNLVLPYLRQIKSV